MLLQAASQSAPNVGAWALGVLGAIAGAVFLAVKKKGEAVDKPSIIYLLVPIPIFALVAWLAHRAWGPGLDAWDFLAVQVLGLLVGVAHSWLMFSEVAGWRALEWPVRDKAWSWKQFGFTILLLLAANAGLMLVGIVDDGARAAWHYWPATITLLVPFLAVKAYDMYMGIPQAVYTPWYPMLDELFTYEPDPQFPKLNVRIALSTGRMGRMKDIPFDPNVRLERIYRWMLHYYLQNESNSYYTDRDGVRYVWGWHFHRQRRGWFRWQRRLDPHRTVRKCGLKDGDTLLAVRVEQLMPLDRVQDRTVKPGSTEPPPKD